MSKVHFADGPQYGIQLDTHSSSKQHGFDISLRLIFIINMKSAYWCGITNHKVCQYSVAQRQSGYSLFSLIQPKDIQ